jgi:hypothetical protein
MRANRTVHFLAVYAPLLIAALLLSFVVVSDAAEPLARAQVGTQDHGDDNEWDVIQNFYDRMESGFLCDADTTMSPQTMDMDTKR